MTDLNKGTGVNYETLDVFKVLAQKAAAATDENIARFGMQVFKPSRGESGFLIRDGQRYLGFVIEGLGTKIIVADEWLKLTGVSYHDAIAQCNVAMIVNDLAAVAVMPTVVAMHVAVGGADYLKNELRARKLVEGHKRACDLAGCVWGPGETPELQDIVNPESMVLSGSAIGTTLGLHIFESSRIRHRDVIVLFHSSGIHANGLTKNRHIAARLPKGYQSEVPGTGGKRYGEVLLTPTHIYTKLVGECLRLGINIRYAVHLTGHGWRKFMRPPESFAYIFHTLPPELPIFDFIQEHSALVGERLTDEQMFASFNMGAGFGILIPPEQVGSAMELVKTHGEPLGIGATVAGYVADSTDGKHVCIDPKKIHYREDALKVR